MRWNPSAGAATYRLQVSTSSSFSSMVLEDSTITDTFRQIGPLKDNTIYFWRVNAKNANGASLWSPAWRFTTIQLPSQVVLVSPSSEEVIKADSLRFTWRKSRPEVNRYWFELAKDSLLTNRIVLDSTLADTTTMVRKLEHKQTYWWRVSAGNAAGWGQFSAPRNFRLDISTLAKIAEDIFIPKEFALDQNYPNPFNPSTTIEFSLPKSVHVELRIYDLKGQEIQVLVNDRKEAGEHSVDFNAVNLQSGVYFYQLRAGDFVQTKKLIVVK
jgi:hypothetical protein